jgi:A/G-specific adenine glycosylase
LRLADVRADLLTWYRASRRDLPWRRTKDAYAIWVSEVMLQQTRVDTVIPYYERFLRRFPTIEALAGADPDAVRAEWSGLGYYRRAGLMLEAARRVVSDHGGRLPAEPDVLAELPGFGPYTAGAVASIAFDRPAPAVDGNVLRVLARIGGIRGDVTRGESGRAVRKMAEALAPGESPGEWTQALMELGATICTPKQPLCDVCPMASLCYAKKHDAITKIPPPRRRPDKRRVELTALVAATDQGEIVLEQRAGEGLFARLWCPPLMEGHVSGSEVANEVRRRFALELSNARRVENVEAVLTHRRLDVAVIHARIEARGHAPLTSLRGLAQIGVPSFTVRLLRAALPKPMLRGVALPGRRVSR